MGTRDDGRLAGMLGDEELQRVVGNFPMRSLAGFPNITLDHATLDEVVERLSPGTGSSTSRG